MDIVDTSLCSVVSQNRVNVYLFSGKVGDGVDQWERW